VSSSATKVIFSTAAFKETFSSWTAATANEIDEISAQQKAISAKGMTGMAFNI
jgi:hypothetical protein